MNLTGKSKYIHAPSFLRWGLHIHHLSPSGTPQVRVAVATNSSRALVCLGAQRCGKVHAICAVPRVGLSDLTTRTSIVTVARNVQSFCRSLGPSFHMALPPLLCRFCLRHPDGQEEPYIVIASCPCLLPPLLAVHAQLNWAHPRLGNAQGGAAAATIW